MVLVKSDLRNLSWSWSVSGAEVRVVCLIELWIFCLSVLRFGIEAMLAQPEANVYLRKIARYVKLA